jgi:hypothetical protein
MQARSGNSKQAISDIIEREMCSCIRYFEGVSAISIQFNELFDVFEKRAVFDYAKDIALFILLR